MNTPIPRSQLAMSLVCGIMLALAGRPVAAADCVYYEDYMRWAGEADVDAEALGVAAANGYLYVTDNNSGLQVFEISDPCRPHLVGQLELENVNHLAAVGTLVYLPTYLGLYVIDVSDPANPAVLATLVTPGSPYGVALAGDYAYVGDGDFQVIDVSDPIHPHVVATLPTDGFAGDVALGDNIACVGDGSGLLIVDISEPMAPHIIGTLYPPLYIVSVALSGQLVFIGEHYGSTNRMEIADISDPAAPQIVGSVELPNQPYAIGVHGSHAFVADDQAGLLGIDIADVTAPAIVGQLDTPGHAWALAVSYPYAYVAHDDGTMVFEITNCETPEGVGSLELPTYAGYLAVAVNGSYAYLTQLWDGLAVIDVSDPAAPVLVAEMDTPSMAMAIDVAGPYAYVAAEYHLVVVDLKPPDTPQIVGVLSLPIGEDPENAHIEVSGDFAFVGSPHWAFYAVDVSDPCAPELVSTLWLPQPVTDMALEGDLAYLTTGTDGLFIIDVSDPSAPEILGSLDPGYVSAVAVRGGLAYVTGTIPGNSVHLMFVVDVSDPGAPLILSAMPRPNTRDIDLSETVAYLAGWSIGLHAVDISDPLSPVYLGGIDSRGEVLNIDLDASYAYLAAGDIGLEIVPLECSPPTAVLLTRLEAIPGDGVIRLCWAPADPALYIGFLVERAAGDEERFTVLNDGQMILEGSECEYIDRSVMPGEDYTYRIAGLLPDGSRQVLGELTAIAPGTRLALMPAAPSPFQDEVRVCFELPDSETPTLTIHDSQGRLVRTIACGPTRQGLNTVLWNGRDERDRLVPAGAYLLRMEWRNHVRLGRVLLVR